MDAEKKDIRYEDGVLTLDGKWEEGELNKIMVSMLANEMDKCGLHPFHSSCVVYKGKTILLVGGENNHGKSMSCPVSYTHLDVYKRQGATEGEPGKS